MKYALFEFEEDNNEAGLAVGESSWIIDVDLDICDNDNFDFDASVEVQWPGCGKKSQSAGIYTAKIHRFSDDRKELRQLLAELVNDDGDTPLADTNDMTSAHGRRLKKKCLDEPLVKTASKTRKLQKESAKVAAQKSATNAQRALLKRLDRQLHPVIESASTVRNDDDHTTCREQLANLEKDNELLKKENQWLRNEVISSLQSFPSLVNTLKGLESVTEQQAKSVKNTKTTDIRTPVPASAAQSPKSTTTSAVEPVMSPVQASRCMTADPRKTTNNLLTASFDATYLATHSLTGAASNKTTSPKPAMDGDAVANIIGKCYIFYRPTVSTLFIGSAGFSVVWWGHLISQAKNEPIPNKIGRK